MASGKALRQGWYIFFVMHFCATQVSTLGQIWGGLGVICWARQTFGSLRMNISTEKNFKTLFQIAVVKIHFNCCFPSGSPLLYRVAVMGMMLQCMLVVISNAQPLMTIFSEIMRFWSFQIVWQWFPSSIPIGVGRAVYNFSCFSKWGIVLRP